MAINHQDNFETNPTSAISVGATTSPLNDIPSIDAPFYLAFDAENANGHYEVAYISSKTATNVNHAALTYAHSTDEVVRMVSPGRELDKIYQAPRGFLLNGKIVPSVNSNNLTVAIKTLSGADPSPSDPVHIRIGDTVREITSALSRTLSAGTSWFNAGSAELAAKEIDYFAYLVWDSNSSAVDISWARIPNGDLVSDFSSTDTNEKYLAGYADFTTTDEVEVVGRFAAFLSAGAGYTWSVPTFTASNLIQRPIYETRQLSFLPTATGFSGTPTRSGTYVIRGGRVTVTLSVNGTSNAATLYLSIPINNTKGTIYGAARGMDNSVYNFRLSETVSTSQVRFYPSAAGGGWTTSGTKTVDAFNQEYGL